MKAALQRRSQWILITITLLIVPAMSFCHACTPQSSQASSDLYNVGFSMYEFKYTGVEGESTILETGVWYPTADTPITYRYSNNFTSTIWR